MCIQTSLRSFNYRFRPYANPHHPHHSHLSPLQSHSYSSIHIHIPGTVCCMECSNSPFSFSIRVFSLFFFPSINEIKLIFFLSLSMFFTLIATAKRSSRMRLSSSIRASFCLWCGVEQYFQLGETRGREETTKRC
jgi:hypothetical protein